MRPGVVRLAVFVASVFAIALAARVVEAADGRLTTKQYDEALRAFISEIDTTYPFFDLKGIRPDWRVCKKSLLSKVRTCRKNEDFNGLLAEARQCLRDAHFRFFDLKGGFPEAEPKFYPGVAFLPAANGQVVVMSTVEDYKKKLPPGSVVLAIDGRNARQVLEEQAAAMWKAGGGFSSPQRARLFVYRLPLQGKEDARHKLIVVAKGQRRTVTVKSEHRVRGWPHTYAMPETLEQEGHCSYGRLKSGFGYVYLRYVGPRELEPVDAALAKLGNARGLIIDVRGNGGGGSYGDILKRFDKRNGPTEGLPHFGGELVVIIDAGTMSAGETFARDLVGCADACLMGSRSAGASTARRTWQLPHGLGSVSFATRSRVGLGGRPIEYKGLTPHVAVDVVPAELARGVNSAIARAEEYLTAKTRRQATQ